MQNQDEDVENKIEAFKELAYYFKKFNHNALLKGLDFPYQELIEKVIRTMQTHIIEKAKKHIEELKQQKTW